MLRLISMMFLVLFFEKSIAQPEVSRPKLVVGVVVDQMRQEYLYRFMPHFSNGGFKRLMTKGYFFKNAHYNYMPTATGPGHASIYTGTTPRMHGIIGNDWYDTEAGRLMYCVEDQSVSAIGGGKEFGAESPKNLLTTTITDELGLFFQGRSKIIGISIKDRSAILPAGHKPTGAYWTDMNNGKFMTSTYYMQELPNWVKDFNARKLPQQYLNEKWKTFFPIETYIESDKDNRPYEKPIAKGIEPVFPYNLKKLSKGLPNAFTMLADTPFGNTLIVEMALAAIENEKLGADDITDFLAISFSSTDKIGHKYGPYSKEIQDAYVRLDRDIERFLNALDKKVGIGNWTLFLTADHAVADIPHKMKEQGLPVDYWLDDEMDAKIIQAIEEKYKAPGLVKKIHYGQLYLNRKVINDNNLDIGLVKAYIIDYLNGIKGVSGAYDVTGLMASQGSYLETRIISAGLNSSRSGDIVFTMPPGWLHQSYKYRGTGHGSQYSYDTHVPMLFYGKGIKAGVSVRYLPITSIAPTLSMLLNIKLPSGCTGQPILEIFE